MKKSMLLHFAVLTLLLITWKIISLFTDPIILPSPEKVSQALVKTLLSDKFFTHLSHTLLRGITGIIISLAAGVVAGIILGINKLLYTVFHPVILFIQATPVISWLLLALIWFSTGTVPVFVIVISITPIVIVSTTEGIRRTDKKLLEMASFYRVSFKDTLLSIYIPSVIGYLSASIRIVTGLAFKIAVMAEVLSHPGTGIGEKLSWARINIETADLIAWTIIVILVTFLIDRLLFLLIEKRFLFQFGTKERFDV